MRMNVYSEELTELTELVIKDPQDDGIVERFYGVRLFLQSPEPIMRHSSAPRG